MAKNPKKEERKKATLGHFDHDDFMEKLSKRIKTLRKQNGFNSYELFAYDIEISRAGMSKYEAGAFDDIRMRTLLKIIDGLGISPKEFFSDGFE
ncbi:helix-turn-helix domain-containing protein [Chitinophaga sp. S165]|uniref:helix-turn-helix domain-containing protein n=1 Tax=Chitinophaga sp. S165 TaxID=2135462 RepID=UPI000D715FBC|nr:helix-turn-helix transcriptional regulator [Chitinophaga sp. S165]PWV56346.1 helix-turn-helix protein [Chitinophaga sp. S165]